MVRLIMRSMFIAATILLATQAVALANDVHVPLRKIPSQFGEQEAQIRKLQECRRTPSQLIGLSIEALRDRCGQFSSDRFIANDAGRFDVVSYGEILPRGRHYLVLYFDDGVVIEAESR